MGLFEIARVGKGGTRVLPARMPRRRRAGFLLSNAVDAQDYARAVEEVRRMGQDPDTIGHVRPAGD